MKKYFILLIMLIVLLTGCGKKNDEKVIDKFEKDLNDSNSYHLLASMDISNDEDTFNYDVEVLYMKDDFYKVMLKNNINDHEQVILKNKDGVYVVTPSLNKSFKFQSDWPNNSSQSYLLNSILNDIKKDEEVSYGEEDGLFVYTNKVNYPNNIELKYEKVYFDKEKKIKSLKVFNNEDVVRIKVDFKNITYNAKVSEDDFKIESVVNDDCCNIDESANALEEIIYPLYIPSETYLKNKETINTNNGERVILTFGGSKNFVLIEETSKSNPELEIIPVYGEPLQMGGFIGALGANSLSWTNNSIDYYLASSDLSQEEMLTIADSLVVTDTVVGK